MANFPQKSRMTTSISDRSNIPFNSRHITTANFFEFGVAKAHYMMPKSSVEIDHNLFCRLDPMPVPTFGEAVIKSRAFFVPYRTVFKPFNYMKEQAEYTTSTGEFGFVTSVPHCPQSVFVQFFKSSYASAFVQEVLPSEDNDEFDFVSPVVSNGNATGIYNAYNFTPAGRLFYKQLIALGYRFNFDERDTTPISLLPLFSLAKVYLDWYANSQYLNIANVKSVEKWLSLDRLNGNYTDFTGQDLEDFSGLLNYVSYDNDYFTSVWDNPNGPNMEQPASAVTIRNVEAYDSVNGGVTTGDDAGSEDVKTNVPVATGPITQFLLNSLRAVSDWMKRKQLVGSRVLDRYLASWGIELPADKLNRSYHIGSSIQDIQIGDVTSMSDTEGAQLGAYAGKGISYGNGHYSFFADEEGVLLIITSIIPKVGYYQGQDRHTLDISPLDFFTGEFDNLGVQAMGVREVYVPENFLRNQAGLDPIDYDSLVFGFVPRYAHYKVGRDCVSGDFILGSKGNSMKSWTLMRDLKNEVPYGITSFKHGPNFIAADPIQYNRIFYITDNTVDHFNIVHNFGIQGSLPCKPVYDNYQFENEDHAQKINVDVAGPKVN